MLNHLKAVFPEAGFSASISSQSINGLRADTGQTTGPEPAIAGSGWTSLASP